MFGFGPKSEQMRNVEGAEDLYNKARKGFDRLKSSSGFVDPMELDDKKIDAEKKAAKVVAACVEALNAGGLSSGERKRVVKFLQERKSVIDKRIAGLLEIKKGLNPYASLANRHDNDLDRRMQEQFWELQAELAQITAAIEQPADKV